MSDLISRSRLIEEIKENQWGWFSREMLLSMLENQPSVTYTNSGKWIPCSERLPQDEEQEYILCVNGTCGNITYDHSVLAGGNYYEDGKWYIDGVLKKNVEVLAWMPLPAPYQPKGE